MGDASAVELLRSDCMELVEVGNLQYTLVPP